MERKNCFEISGLGVLSRVDQSNGTLYTLWDSSQKLTNIASSTIIADASTATTEDVATAYNDLADKFNDLLTYLQNNNLMATSS